MSDNEELLPVTAKHRTTTGRTFLSKCKNKSSLDRFPKPMTCAREQDSQDKTGKDAIGELN